MQRARMDGLNGRSRYRTVAPASRPIGAREFGPCPSPGQG